MTLPARTTLAAVLSAAALAITAAGCGGDDDDGSGGSSTPGAVGMKNLKFTPSEITVKVGEKITWTNEESVPHDVVADSGADFKSEVFSKDGTFTFTPTKAGTITYECTLHPGMDGTIEVTG